MILTCTLGSLLALSLGGIGTGAFIFKRKNKQTSATIDEYESQIKAMSAQNESLKESYKRIEDKAADDITKIRKAASDEYQAKIQEFKQILQAERDREQEELKSQREEESKKLQDDKEKEVAAIKLNYQSKIKEIENEFNEACEQQVEDLKKQIDNVDKILGERIEEIKTHNTLYFKCVCKRPQPIPCEIDFAKEENYFSCPDCGAIYRVELNAYPVLISNITTNGSLADLIEQRSRDENEEIEPTVEIPDEYGEIV